MTVLHLATHDTIGGAARAAYRQHKALQRSGIDSRMWVNVKMTSDSTVEVWRPPRTMRHRMFRTLRRHYLKALLPKQMSRQPFSDDRSQYAGSESEHLPPHDVINLHWAAGFVNQPTLFRACEPETPVVVTMHDMNAFTGGCHYDMGCGRFADKCGRCPQLRSNKENDLSRSIWRRKYDSYAARSSSKLHFVANSKWLAGQAARSSLLRSRPVSVIHYGLDTEIFRPFNRAHARQALGIPDGSRVLMFAADSVDDERKGGRYVREALARLETPVFLLTAGRGQPPALDKVQGLHLGVVESEHLMALAYNAAEVFLMPSVQEAFGQTALEAAACGTPVVAFEEGGIPEVVIHEDTGLLCSARDALDLAQAVDRLLSDNVLRRRLGANARAHVEAKFTYQICAGRYVRLYEDLLNVQ
jgi:glycosyltransferase involved in cell wall biosynthesis